MNAAEKSDRQRHAEIRHALERAGVLQRDIATQLNLGEPAVSRILSGHWRGTTPRGRETRLRVLAAVDAVLGTNLVEDFPLPVPPCGSPHHRSVRNCRACKNAWSRSHRPAYGDLPAAERRKANVRSHANLAQQRGQLSPQPCAKCGGTPAEKHHPDYAKPLEVEWLCRKCHRKLHREARGTRVPRRTQEVS